MTKSISQPVIVQTPILKYDEGGQVDITGVGDMDIRGLKLCQGAAKGRTIAEGEIIIIMSQFANLGSGKTIHAPGQLCIWKPKSLGSPSGNIPARLTGMPRVFFTSIKTSIESHQTLSSRLHKTVAVVM